MIHTLDLFAGPGGWDIAAAALGLSPIGLELDRDACATRAAAGHRTVRTDVAHYPPEPFRGYVGLMASPPCQAFSRAGKRKGKDDARALRAHLLASARTWQEPAPVDEWSDPRSPLVLEPLRYVHTIGPEWIVLEQVPPVLALWQTYDVVLSGLGYSVWCGNLNAADYGVPQIRWRAVLIATRTRRATEPRKTHGGHRAPYVTMAAALGWDEPSPAMRLNRGAGISTKARSAVWIERRNDQTDTEWIDRDWPLTRPATTIAGRGLVPDPGANANRFNGSTKSRNDGVRVTDEEAATLQAFPAGYPWQGTMSKRFEQIGNAVPPPMARAILETVAA